MPDVRAPVQVKKGDDGEIRRILLLEEWYDALKSFYDTYKFARDIVSIKKFPEMLDQVADLVNNLVVEFGAYGWAITVSIAVLTRYAAALSVSIGKFAYQRVGQSTTAGGSLAATAGGPIPGTAGASIRPVELSTYR